MQQCRPTCQIYQKRLFTLISPRESATVQIVQIVQMKANAVREKKDRMLRAAKAKREAMAFASTGGSAGSPFQCSARAVLDERVDRTAIQYSYEAYELGPESAQDELEANIAQDERPDMRVPSCQRYGGWCDSAEDVLTHTRFLIAMDGPTSACADTLFVAARGTDKGARENIVTDIACVPVPLKFGGGAIGSSAAADRLSGQPVEVHGLASAAGQKLNGRAATAKEFNQERQRYRLVLDDDGSEAFVKPENVKAASSVSVSGATVHAGFQHAYNQVRADLLRGVNACLEWCKAGGRAPPARVVFTGHSLGGALATLAALDASLHPAAFGLAHRPAWALLTWGCPHVGDAAFAAVFNAQLRSDGTATAVRVINASDPVPSVFAKLQADAWAHVGGSAVNIERELGHAVQLCSGAVDLVRTLAQRSTAQHETATADTPAKAVLGLVTAGHGLGAYFDNLHARSKSPGEVLFEDLEGLVRGGAGAAASAAPSFSDNWSLLRTAGIAMFKEASKGRSMPFDGEGSNSGK
jgi:hypothetical protein